MGVFTEELPGEQELAQYRSGRIVLTNLRVRHQQGRNRSFVALGAITGIGLQKRRMYLPVLLLVPLAVAVFFTFLAITIMDDYFVFVLFGVPLTIPLAFAFRGTMLEVSAQGFAIRERVPMHLRDEALAFIHEVEAARHQMAAPAATAAVAPMPTAVPFLR